MKEKYTIENDLVHSNFVGLLLKFTNKQLFWFLFLQIISFKLKLILKDLIKSYITHLFFKTSKSQYTEELCNSY